MFKIRRVLNNNVISVTEDRREVILAGPGLGFGKRGGDVYDPAKVEQRFVLADTAAGYISVMVSLSYELIALSNRVKDHLRRELGITLSSAQQLALADHLQCALERTRQGISLDSALVWELKSTYGPEFGCALQIMEMVREATGVELPLEEAAFITTHVINAELTGDLGRTTSTTRAVRDIVAIVAEHVPGLEHGTADYARFLTHVKYAVQRIEDKSMLTNADRHLYEVVRDKEPESHACAVTVREYVHDQFDVVLPDEEMLYLMLHIGRLRTRMPASRIPADTAPASLDTL